LIRKGKVPRRTKVFENFIGQMLKPFLPADSSTFERLQHFKGIPWKQSATWYQSLIGRSGVTKQRSVDYDYQSQHERDKRKQSAQIQALGRKPVDGAAFIGHADQPRR
jgi:hypothetical protein